MSEQAPTPPTPPEPQPQQPPQPSQISPTAIGMEQEMLAAVWCLVRSLKPVDGTVEVYPKELEEMPRTACLYWRKETNGSLSLLALDAPLKEWLS